MPTTPTDIAPGTNKDFAFTCTTTAPEAIWTLWTTPQSWGQWDKGLTSADVEGPMALGARGRITPRSGPSSPFKVVLFEPGVAYAFETRLPGAMLRVHRFFDAGRTSFTHHVTFHGFSSVVFAQLFGPGFRRALPPTMCALKNLAEAA